LLVSGAARHDGRVKILVVGAGVIGTIYGQVLQGAGHDVVHLVRPGRAAALRDGIRVDLRDTRRGRPKRFRGTYALRATEEVPLADFVVVPTKPYQLSAALEVTVQVNRESPHLLLTQNWQGTGEVETLLRREHFIYGDAQAGGTFSDGTLVAAIFPPRIFLGTVDGGDSRVLDLAARTFEDAGIAVKRPFRILEHIWVQYAINAGLWTGVVRSGGIRPLLTDRRTSYLTFKAVEECLNVVAARGVELCRYPDARLYWPSTWAKRQLASLAMNLMFRFDERLKRTSAHVLGDPREITDAYRSLLTTGRDAGVDMPIMASFEQDMDRLVA
jgi:2-dehydropantoate 2-reductase